MNEREENCSKKQKVPQIFICILISTECFLRIIIYYSVNSLDLEWFSMNCDRFLKRYCIIHHKLLRIYHGSLQIYDNVIQVNVIQVNFMMC